MEIRIDTAKDSKEDIIKAIRLLQSLAEDNPLSSSSQSQDFQSGENVLGGFFDAPDATPQPQDDAKEVSVMPGKKEENKDTKTRKFSIGSAGGFDIY